MKILQQLPILLGWLLFSASTVVLAHPPPPQENDVFGTVFGCAGALLESDKNYNGEVKRDEYLNFVNLLADFLCVPERNEIDLELSTVFVSISCLCVEREGFGEDCCIGNNAAIFTQGAEEPIFRTEDEDSYLRAACLLTQAVLGPSQCTLEEQTVPPQGVVIVRSGGDDDFDIMDWIWLILGALLLLLSCLCLLLCCCLRRRGDNDKDEELTSEVIITRYDEANKIKTNNDDDEESNSKQMDNTQVDVYGRKSSTFSISPPPPAPRIKEEMKEEEETDLLYGPGKMVSNDDSSVYTSNKDDDSDKNKKIAFHGNLPDDTDDETNRKFRGEGGLPGDKDSDAHNLRPVEIEPGAAPGDYDYPIREMEEIRHKDMDEGQVLDHYVPDGGVHMPTRPEKEPVVMPTHRYKRHVKVEPEPYDSRKQRIQMALGDGEVWDALQDYSETDERTAKLDKMDWVVESGLHVLTKADEAGDLTRLPSSTSGDSKPKHYEDDQEISA